MSASDSKRRGFRVWLGRVWLGWAWRWSLVVTLPLCLWYGLWLAAVVGPYQDWGLRYRNGREAGMLTQIMNLEWGQQQRRTRQGAVMSLERSKRLIPRVELQLDKAQEQTLNAALPASGREYVEAAIQGDGGDWEPVEVRYRGDFYWHWALEKKSWRVKTKKADLWQGMRRFNLIVPKSPALIDGHLGYWLAREMDLLAPRSGLRELWIGGSNRGIHTLVEQPEELMLRTLERMPCDLYVGELVGRDSYPGRNERLFQAPALWTKAAVHNHFDDDHYEPMVALTRAIERVERAEDPGPAEFSDLRARVHYPSFARFAFYRALCQSGHHDDLHNWRLYYDPWRAGFEPVVWDPNAWHRLWAPRPDRPAFTVPLFSALDRALARDPQFRWELHRVAVESLEAGVVENTLQAVDDFAEQVDPVLHRDAFLVEHFVAYGPAEVRAAIAALRQTVLDYGTTQRQRHLEAPLQVQGALEVFDDGAQVACTLEVAGHRPVARVELRFAGDLPEGEWSAHRVDGPQEGDPGESDPGTGNSDGGGTGRLQASATGRTIWVEAPMVPGLRIEADPKKHFAMPYHGVPTGARHRIALRHSRGAWPALESVLVHPLRGAATQVPVVEALPETTASPWDRGASLGLGALREPQVWSGTRTIEGVQRVDAPLIWEPGLRLRMGPGACLIVRGQVTAQGTAENPIWIDRADPEQAWGTLALVGPQADGSQLLHVHAMGGSGWQTPLESYTGMLSLHDVDGVTLAGCRFQDSEGFDDMVHAVYAQGLVLRDCRFQRAEADGLDLDGCRAWIEDCHFFESGNDGIDLMMSRVTVTGTTLVRNGDKGISVGERSLALVVRSPFRDNRMALQVKDDSHAWVRHCQIHQRGSALAGIVKNWRYGTGGTGLFEACDFEGRGDLEVSKRSRLTFAGGRGADRWAGQKRVVVGDREATVQEWPARSLFLEDDFFVRWLSPGDH